MPSEEFQKRVNEEIDSLTASYGSAVDLLRDAMGEAMPWAAKVVAGRGVPTSGQLFSLGTKALAIAYATEEERKRANRKAGY